MLSVCLGLGLAGKLLTVPDFRCGPYQSPCGGGPPRRRCLRWARPRRSRYRQRPAGWTGIICASFPRSPLTRLCAASTYSRSVRRRSSSNLSSLGFGLSDAATPSTVWTGSTRPIHKSSVCMVSPEVNAIPRALVGAHCQASHIGRVPTPLLGRCL
jgi:hypothetical protein